MRWRLLLPAAWLVLLGLSVALSVLAAQHDTLPGDVAIATWAQDRPFPGDALSHAVRAVTATQVVLGVGASIAVGLWLVGRRRDAVLLAIGLIVLPVLQWGLKEMVDRPRPAELALSGAEGPLVDVRTGFTSPSFPSGHVMSPSYLYGFLLWLSLFSRWLPAARWPVACWSVLILLLAGPPNVWLGVHWPSDVLGGWAWALVLLTPLLYSRHLTSTRR